MRDFNGEILKQREGEREILNEMFSMCVLKTLFRGIRTFWFSKIDSDLFDLKVSNGSSARN